MRERSRIAWYGIFALAWGCSSIRTPPKKFENDIPKISFGESIVFQDRFLSIDSKPRQSVPCQAEDNPPPFAHLETGPNQTIELFCQDDYLGGIWIHSSNKDEPRMILSQRDGDAGDAWDIRSEIRKSPAGDLVLITQTLSSHEELIVPDQKEFLGCEASARQWIWSGARQTFVEVAPPKPDPALFSKPIHVDQRCLDAQGQWSPTVVYQRK